VRREYARGRVKERGGGVLGKLARLQVGGDFKRDEEIHSTTVTFAVLRESFKAGGNF